MLALDSFATDVDWLLERTVGSGATSVSFGQASFTDLDFADDISLLAKLLELLVPALKLLADEAASLGLEVNWQKTKIQALGRTEGVPLTITVKYHEVAVAEEFVYLGSLIHSSTQSTHDINRCSGHSSRSHAESRQPDLEVTCLNVNEAEVVQYVHSAYLTILLYPLLKVLPFGARGSGNYD